MKISTGVLFWYIYHKMMNNNNILMVIWFMVANPYPGERTLGGTGRSPYIIYLISILLINKTINHIESQLPLIIKDF
jgi:hypothetical protein